jgi:lipoprotein-releasing system permease protein
VGSDLAGQLGLMVGDRITIYAPRDLKQMKDAHVNGSERLRIPDDYEVRGVFSSGWYEYDANFILVSLENAQSLYELGGNVHGLSIAVDDPLLAERYAREIAATLSGDLGVSSWMRENPTMVAVMVEKNLMLYILFFIVLVAAFGITCTTITFVVMKTGDVGLLKALGATSRQVMNVFLMQSLIVSFFGILCGTSFGLLAIHYRNEFLDLMRRLTGLELFPASVYGFSRLPALVLPGDLAVICGGSLIICLLAAILPARHASKLEPVEALRHE